MTKTSAMIVKRLPSPRDQVARRLFLREIKRFVVNSYRPRLIVDLSAVEQISPESVDLLLECLRHWQLIVHPSRAGYGHPWSLV